MNYMSLFPFYTRSLPRFSALAAAILSQTDDLIAVIRDYRDILRAKLVLWTWDGANDTAQGVMDRICPGSTICDNCDGTVSIHAASALQAEQGLYPLPAGVRAVIS